MFSIFLSMIISKIDAPQALQLLEAFYNYLPDDTA